MMSIDILRRIHRSRSADRPRRRETGAVAIEFVGTFFMYLVLVLVTLQALLAMFALAQANSAARNAARSEAVQVGSGTTAGEAAVAQPLRNSGTAVACTRSGGTTGHVSCSASIVMPMFNLAWMPDWVPQLTVTREAVQPITEVP